MCLVFTSESLWMDYWRNRRYCSRYLWNTNREREVMSIIEGLVVIVAIISGAVTVVNALKEK